MAVVSVGGLALAGGGYFPVTWGVSGVALFCVSALALAARREIYLSRLELLLTGLLAAYAVWVFASLAWSGDSARTALEGDRTLVYLGAIVAALMLSRRHAAATLLTGTWLAITVACTYGLATRLFPVQFGSPDPIFGQRLSEPLGYGNALGLFAAIGTVLALGLAARARRVLRCAAAASVVPLLLALYFTFSRGAWIALFAALVVVVAVDQRRLQLVTTGLVLAPWPVIGILLASRSKSLTYADIANGSGAADGHGLAVITIVLMAAGALSLLGLAALENVYRPSPTTRRFYSGALAVLVTATVVTAIVRSGPAQLPDHAYRSITSSPPQWQANLNLRLLNLSSNGRTQLWHTAWHDFEAHPWLGSGAGTYAVYWFRDRRVPAPAHEAHSLYLETIAELGVAGLLLLVATLAVPFVAMRGARGSPLAATALAAYSAYLLHAAIDWDWEVPAVTLAGLFCGLSVILDARPLVRMSPVPLRFRLGAAGAAAGLTLFAFVGLLGHALVSASSAAARAGNWTAAENEARDAMSYLPWSEEPWRKLGEAQFSASAPGTAAQASFRTAAAKAPRDWTIWFELAISSDGRQRMLALRDAAALNPLSPELRRFQREAHR